jgi:hypothetical protein
MKYEVWRNAIENWIVDNNAEDFKNPSVLLGGRRGDISSRTGEKYSLYGKHSCQQLPHSLVRDAQLGKPWKTSTINQIFCSTLQCTGTRYY